MTRFADKFKVESSRLVGWDYSNNGIYFITVCTRYHNNFLGKVVDGRMEYWKAGKIVIDELLKTFELRKYLRLIAWVVMPNHLHILFGVGDGHVETRGNASQTNNREMTQFIIDDKSLNGVSNDVLTNETRYNASLPGDSIRTKVISNYRNHPDFYNKLNMKSNQEVSKIIREFKGAVKKETNKRKIFFVWQERYYDEIVNDENKLNTITYYINNNVKNWEKDKLFSLK